MKMRYKQDASVFYRENKRIHSEYHNIPLYATVSIHDVELWRGLVDLGSSLNKMPLITLKVMGIPQEHVVATYRDIKFWRGRGLNTWLHQC